MNLDPRPGMIPGSVPGLETLMDAAWPAAEREESGGWVLRAASGVTQRANSVWPRDPGEDPHRQLAAVRDARLWYRSRRLPLIFQIFDGPRHAALNAVLDAEGFTRQSETLVLVHVPGAESGVGPGAPEPAVEISAGPSAEWLELWWSVDGRGGADELAVARGILEGCPSLYALVRDDGGAPRLAQHRPVRARVGRAVLHGNASGCTASGLWRPGGPGAAARGRGPRPGGVLAAGHGLQRRCP